MFSVANSIMLALPRLPFAPCCTVQYILALVWNWSLQRDMDRFKPAQSPLGHLRSTRSPRVRMAILFFTLVVVMMGFGMIIPILPYYMDVFGASGTELGLLMATFATMQFFFAPLWGQLSDRYGRKPILRVGVLGNAISLLFFGLSTELWMLFASRALAGILSSATLPTAIGLTSALVQGVLTGSLTRRWGEVAVIRGSLVGSAVGFVLMLQAGTYAGVLVTVSFFVLSNAMLRPAISSLISKRATGGQGVAMGLNNSFMSLGRMVGPAWAGFIYDLNLTYPYHSGAVVMLAGFFMSLVWLRPEAPALRPVQQRAGEVKRLGQP